MELKELLDFAAEVGKCLLESGGETSRVEDTLTRIIKHFYNGHSEIFVVLTGFFVNIEIYTVTVRVGKRTINLEKVSKINMMSRDIVSGKIGFREAVERFEEIKRSKGYPVWVKTLSAAVSCAFFTLLQNGGLSDSLNSFLVGAAVYAVIWLMRRHSAADFIATFSGGVLIAMLTALMYTLGLGGNINIMIAGSIMPFVPGLAVTNALRDIIAGDYLSGGARIFDAVVTAAALAAGAGAMMYMLEYISGGRL